MSTPSHTTATKLSHSIKMAASPLKIGLVLDDSLDKADGVQQYVLGVGSWLKSQGHDVHYLVSTTKRTDVTNIHNLGKNIAVRFNGNRMSMPLPSSRSAIRAFLNREQFDVLHVQLPHSPWLAQRVINEAAPQTAIIGTFHIVPQGLHVKVASRLLAVWTRSSLKRFDTIVSVSTAAQLFAKKTFKLTTTVVPNVIDYDRFNRAKPFPQFADKLTVVFLGRLVPRKGCMTLLEAVALLAKRMQDLPSFRVIVCGKGPLEAKLKAYAQEHHLVSMVQFTGFITEEDKPRYLKSADIAVFPSTGGESFGIVLAEAMAANAAVLAGDNSGYRSVMSEHAELLFPPKHASALADKLATFLRNADLRNQATVWGHNHAKQYDTDVVGSQLVEIYNQALLAKRNVR